MNEKVHQNKEKYSFQASRNFIITKKYNEVIIYNINYLNKNIMEKEKNIQLINKIQNVQYIKNIL